MSTFLPRFLISFGAYNQVDNMGKVTVRTSFTSRSFVGLSPYNDDKYIYSLLMINLGNNPLSKIEIVSALNSFNLGREFYTFYYANRASKYNPKLYLGTIQTASVNWNADIQYLGQTDPQNPSLGAAQKSGSWPQIN